jgi:dTDP-4-dehydrorhamnose reductase
MKPVVVVTGTNGQLGWELKQLSVSLEDKFHFIFTDRATLDIANPNSIAPFFDQVVPNYFINCAAYTAVDKAETEQELALTINGKSVGIIAECCEKHHCKLITISTDYVFDGNGSSPYTVTTPTDPVNYYGYSKLVGEELAQKNNPSSIIIRTSWVYSTHGNNFVKTMLRLMKERDEIKVVSDQVGAPTYAADLAKALIHIVEEDQKGNKHSGIYHYSNTGVISWHDFAMEIRKLADFSTTIIPIPTSAYPTPAKRPAYSVMDLSKTEIDFSINLRNWNDSLRDFFHQLNL